jgi:pimeloyl-ACP methyl ester carboxylesterase
MDPSWNISEITRAALTFEQYQWATGSVLEDPFYSVDERTASTPAGTLLKVERNTNTALYSLPPGTALSRIVYQSKNFNRSLVPVSAYILWPHSPRSAPDGYQVVAFSHGTSGIAPNGAPSHIKNLWQHYLAPFNLALQGYVVVATDYAGLGVSKNAQGEPIIHEYVASPSHANDVFYSVEAAQTAFPELSKSFVVLGHSQGGGSAWAAAQRQAVEPVHGYLGAVAVSPVTTIIDPAMAGPTLSAFGFLIAAGMENIFPGFDRSDILTPGGVQKLGVVQETNGCSSTVVSLIVSADPAKPKWTENTFVQKFQDLTKNGGKEVGGPLLVIHGDADPILNISLTTSAAEETARKFPASRIEYLRLPGISHNAALTSSQWQWMDWIAKRFDGIPQEPGLRTTESKVAMPLPAYQTEVNWWLAPATIFYETP